MRNFAFVFLAIFTVSQAEAAFLSKPVTAGNSNACSTYLRVPEISKKVPLFITLSGTGTYSTADDKELPPQVNYLFQNKKVMVLTVDKPGISWTEGKAVVNDGEFNRYTVPMLVKCVDEAVKWVLDLKDTVFNGRIFINGHSEGAMVAVSLIQNYAKSQNPTLPKIEMVILSGVPMESFKKVITSQLSKGEKAKFWNAFSKKDDKYLRSWGNVSYRYLVQAFGSQSLDEVFRSLAALSVKTNFQIYQGLEDKNTSSLAVRNFETWNETQKESKKPSLNFNARYYEAGHYLNLTAVNDMVTATLAYLSSD